MENNSRIRRRTLKEIVIEAIRQGHDVDTFDLVTLFGESYSAMFGTDYLKDHKEEAEGINNFFDVLRFMIMQEYDIGMSDLEIETFHRVCSKFNLKRDYKCTESKTEYSYINNIRALERHEMQRENKEEEYGN